MANGCGHAAGANGNAIHEVAGHGRLTRAAAEQVQAVELAGGGGPGGNALDFLLELFELPLQIITISLCAGAVIGHDG